MAIDEKVKEILQFVFELDGNSDVSSLSIDTVSDWDSMKQVAIVSALENEFDLFIEIEDAEKMTSYVQIVDYLNKN